MLDTEAIEEKTVESCSNVNSDKIDKESTAGQQEISFKETIPNEIAPEVKQSTAEMGEVNASNTDSMISHEMEVTENVQEIKTTDNETKAIETDSMHSEVIQPNESIKTDEQIVEDLVLEEVVETNDKATEATQPNRNNNISIEMEADTKRQSTENHVPPTNVQTVKSIGSLGLLNQYASSSDDDADSSSDDDSGSVESESDSDDTSSIEVIEAPSDVDKNVDAAAKSILDSVMSRANYRDVSSDS